MKVDARSPIPILLVLCLLTMATTIAWSYMGRNVNEVVLDAIVIASYLAGMILILVWDGVRPNIFQWIVALTWPLAVMGHVVVTGILRITDALRKRRRRAIALPVAAVVPRETKR